MEPHVSEPAGPLRLSRCHAPRDADGADVPPAAVLPGTGSLTAMPLHVITSMYGEAGLRALLTAELPALDGPAGLAGQALDLAGELHIADRRQAEPYVNHLLRVSLRIIRWGIRDPEVAAAALLHDAVEDHAAALAPGGGRAGALAVLASRFGERTAALVAAVTNPPRAHGASDGERRRQYLEHVTASLEASPWARVVKLSDHVDNGVGLMWTSGPAVTKLARKYAPLVPVLAGFAARPDTPLPVPARERVLRQLGQAGQRFTAILADGDGEA